jgi:hypothetical protein
LKPLEGSTWLNDDARSIGKDDTAKIERARELSKIYTRTRVAEIMRVSRVTLWRLLGKK